MNDVYRKTIKNTSRYPFPMSKEELENLYADEHLSMSEIGKRTSSSRQRVSRWLTYYGISKRTGIQQMHIARADEPHGPNWRGGRWYVKKTRTWFVYAPNHPKVKHNGGMEEHILNAEERIGRPTTEKEVVHHLDEDRDNNSPENLCVMLRALHSSLHRVIGDVGITLLCRGEHDIVMSCLGKRYQEIVRQVYIEKRAVVKLKL